MDAVAVKVQTKEERDFYRIAEGISLLYLGVIFLIYPFYFRNGYFDILQAKFSFFWISSLAYSAIMTLFLLLYAFTLKKEERSRIYTKLFSPYGCFFSDLNSNLLHFHVSFGLYL